MQASGNVLLSNFATRLPRTARIYLSKVSLVNYRNFEFAKFVFKPGVNTIIGENGSGKSNLFRAIRLLLDSNIYRAAHELSEGDYSEKVPHGRGLDSYQLRVL